MTMVKNLVYDVGMNDGSDTLHYLEKGFRVVAIEADPTLVDSVRMKLKKYVDEKQLVLVNCGVAGEDGTADFYINKDNHVWNSFDAEKASRGGTNYYSIKVQCRNFKDILKEHDVPYYLKIDIEGYDEHCVSALDPNNLPQYVSFEADNQGDHKMLDIIYGKGYRKFKLINQNTLAPVTVPYVFEHDRKSLDKNDRYYLDVMYSKNFFMRVLRKLQLKPVAKSILKPQHHLSFHIGSSGPFGEELPGKWLSYEEVKKLYTDSYRDFAENVTDKNRDYWADFHASL
jgi:FkbM family methyltransferase